MFFVNPIESYLILFVYCLLKQNKYSSPKNIGVRETSELLPGASTKKWHGLNCNSEVVQKKRLLGWCQIILIREVCWDVNTYWRFGGPRNLKIKKTNEDLGRRRDYV